jgi:hypothetical protein
MNDSTSGLEVWDSYANGVLLVDDSALRAIGDALQIAEESSDDLALGAAKYALGVALMNRGGSDRERGLEVLMQFRDMCLDERFALSELAAADFWTAYERDMVVSTMVPCQPCAKLQTTCTTENSFWTTFRRRNLGREAAGPRHTKRCGRRRVRG